MALTSNSNLLNSYTTIIAQETLKLLTSNFVMRQFVATPEDMRASYTQGNTVDFIVDPVFTVSNAGVSDTERTYQTPSQSKISLTLDYFKEVAPRYTDLDQVIANPALTIDQYPRAAALALAAQIEKDLFSLALNDANVPANNEVGTDATPLNAKALREIRTKFAKMGVSADTDRIVIVSPDQYGQLLADTVITEQQTRGDGLAIQTGRIGTAYGMTIVESNYLPTNDNLASVSGSNANPVGIATTRGALVYGMRPLSQETMGVGTARTVTQGGYSLRFRMWSDPARNQYKMVTDILYGAKVVGRPALHDSTVYYPVLPILGGVA